MDDVEALLNEAKRSVARHEGREDSYNSRRDDYDRGNKAEFDAESTADQAEKTVFVGNLNIHTTEKDLQEHFEKQGLKVRDVQIIMDKRKISKGCAYVEFETTYSAMLALGLSSSILLNQPIIVQKTQFEKNVQASTSNVAQGPRKIFISNLNPYLNEDDLQMVFETFGIINVIHIKRDGLGKPSGAAIIEFKQNDDAKKAQQYGNGLELAGQKLKISCTDPAAVNYALQASLAQLHYQQQMGGAPSTFPNLSLTRLATGDFAVGGLPAGLAGSAATAVGSGGVPFGIPPLATPPLSPLREEGPRPSPFVLLTNMFDPREAIEDPEFHVELKEDVESECGNYGKLLDVLVDKNSAGHVYMQYSEPGAAGKAIMSLNGRWFAGKVISATYISSDEFHRKKRELSL